MYAIRRKNTYFFQGVLTQVTQATKITLNQLGVFTVSSIHAYICARSPSLLSNLLAGRGASRRKTHGNNGAAICTSSNKVGNGGESFDSYSKKSDVNHDDDMNHTGAVASIPVLLPNKTVSMSRNVSK